MNLDARALFYYNAGGVTPAMATTHVGEGSDYALAFLDSEDKPFDGSKTYRLHLPPNVPVNNFWAVTLYDTQTRTQLQTSQLFPTVGSQTKGMKKNADGSYDVYFAPKAPEAKKATGCKRCRARAGSPSCACMGRWNPGSTRPGVRAISNFSLDTRKDCS